LPDRPAIPAARSGPTVHLYRSASPGPDRARRARADRPNSFSSNPQRGRGGDAHPGRRRHASRPPRARDAFAHRHKTHPLFLPQPQNPPPAPPLSTNSRSSGGGTGGQAAKDALGNDVTENAWLKTHPANTRELTQGLKGDPTYLIVNGEAKIESYGLNAVCTHLGCVVPWVGAENKFKCPCHGSQYNAEGKVIRGPAPLSLALAHASVAESGVVQFAPWTETDFRTGVAPWWK